eukprot:14275-Chlamydomonas_euryale.AAC.2
MPHPWRRYRRQPRSLRASPHTLGGAAAGRRHLAARAATALMRAHRRCRRACWRPAKRSAH